MFGTIKCILPSVWSYFQGSDEGQWMHFSAETKTTARAISGYLSPGISITQGACVQKYKFYPGVIVPLFPCCTTLNWETQTALEIKISGSSFELFILYCVAALSDGTRNVGNLHILISFPPLFDRPLLPDENLCQPCRNTIVLRDL